jgi:soluble lytic murein transglycosylase
LVGVFRGSMRFRILVLVLAASVSYATADTEVFQQYREFKTEGKNNEAAELLQKYIENNPESAQKGLMEFALGIQAFEDGKDNEAVKLLTSCRESQKHLSDYIDYYLGLSYMRMGRFKDSRKTLNSVVSMRPRSSNYMDARFALGKLQSKRKKFRTASNHFRYLERRIRHTAKYPLVLLELVRSEIGRKRKWIACRWARKLYSKHPEHEIIKDWNIDLQNARLDGKKLRCMPTRRDQSRRIRNLQNSGQSQRARNEIEILQKRTNALNKYSVDMLLAGFLRKEGYADEALKLMLVYYKEKSNQFRYLKMLARIAAQAGEFQLSVGAYYRAYKMRPRWRSGRNALFYSAYTSYQYQDYDGASRRFKEYRRRYPRTSLARDAEWYIAWIRYLKKDYKGAYESFSKLMFKRRGRRHRISREKLRYWRAVAELKMGRLSSAKRSLKELTHSSTFSYYSIAAQARLSTLSDVEDKDNSTKNKPLLNANFNLTQNLRQPATFEMLTGVPTVKVVELDVEEPEEIQQLEEDEKDVRSSDEADSDELEVFAEGEEDFDEEAEDEKLAKANNDDEVDAPEIVEQPVITSFQDPRLTKRFTKSNDLRKLGFKDWARWELYGIERRTSNRTYLKMLMSEYSDISAYRRSSYIGEIFFHSQRVQGGMQGAKYLWEFTYPRAYKNWVNLYADKFGVAPEFAWAIMRAESHYNKEARSSVGALGLMQIMPNTGMQVAKLLEKEKFEVKDLLTPKTNIELGIRYLNRLSKKFKGRVPLVSAAYNAGPHRVELWLKYFGRLDIDEFIEHIPFSQTRNYAKKVSRNYFVYQKLYFEKDIVSSPITWLTQPVGVSIKGPVATRETWEEL